MGSESSEMTSGPSGSLSWFFEQNFGSRVFVPRLPGNHGDELMRIALDLLLRRYGMTRINTARGADWILIRGNGAMNDFWRNGLDALAYYSKTFPHVPLAVLPASYDFAQTNLNGILQHRTSRCVLFAREKGSFERLKSLKLPQSVELHIDHDTALLLQDEPLIDKFRRIRIRRTNSSEGYILIVERRDCEHVDLPQMVLGESKLPMSAHPLGIRLAKAIGRHPRRIWCQFRWQHINGILSERVSERLECEVSMGLRDIYPQYSTLTWRCGDVSDPLKYSFQQFCSLISKAEVVATTRLHVAIFSAMLGVPTLIRTGNTDKIGGVWDLSLRLYHNVKLLTTEGSPS